MKKIFSSLFVLFALLLSSADAANVYSRIVFAKGKAAKNVHGTLNGFKDKKVFKLRVRQGQTISTEQIKADTDLRSITIILKDAEGNVLNDMDASCNNRNEVTASSAGDYVLEVTQCQKADEWKGGFTFKVNVK